MIWLFYLIKKVNKYQIILDNELERDYCSE